MNCPFLKDREARRGQSLVEILLALALGVIMILTAVSGIAPSLKVNADAARTQVATALGRELMGGVRVLADARWTALSSLATSSANTYYLVTTSSPFTVGAGTQNIVVGSTTYTRYFYVDDVNRDGSGFITAGAGTDDPATKKVTVVYRWPNGPSSTMLTYVTRSRNNIFLQTDWIGGPTEAGPVSTTINSFATSSNINYATTSGSFQIDL